MKELAEIMRRMAEIEVEIRDASGDKLTALETETNTLLERKKVLEAKAKEFELKFAEGRKVNLKVKEDDIDKSEEEDRFATNEYRKMFRDYVTRKSDRILEHRTDYVTETTDVGVIIPTTVMNNVIRELKDYGKILPLVTFTNLPGGVKIPIAGIKPTASWVGESAVASKQKQEVTLYVTFGYYKLQIRVARNLMVETVVMSLWEQLVATNIAEAMAVALETSVVTGSGNGQPLGIVNDLYDGGVGTGRVPVANQVSVKVADLTYTGWITKLFSSIPTAYRNARNGVIFMHQSTYDKYVLGLVDENKQPIGRVTAGVGSAPDYRLIGTTVIPVSYLPSFDLASNTDVFCIYADLSNYIINTNMQITYRTYFDEDTDEQINKATMIVDGKLGDAYGVIVLKKDTSA